MAAIARNLRAGGRRRRLLMGLVFSAVAVGAAVVLIAAGLPRGLRALLVVPFYLSVVGLLQYRDHTWVALAARGQREGEQGVEDVGDNWLMRQLRRQARELLIEGALGAVMLTGIALMLPG